MPSKTYTPGDMERIRGFLNSLKPRTVTISSTEATGTITSLQSAEDYFSQDTQRTYARLGEHVFLPQLIDHNNQFFDALNELENALPENATVTYVDDEDKIGQKIRNLNQKVTDLLGHLQKSNDLALAGFKEEVTEVSNIIAALGSSNYLDVRPLPMSQISINAPGAKLALNKVEIYGYLEASVCPAELWPSDIPKVELNVSQIQQLSSAEGLQLFMPGDETYTLRRDKGQFTASYEKEVNLTNKAQVSTIVNMIDNLVAQSTNEPISLTIQSQDKQFQTVAKEYLAMLKQARKDINCTLNGEKIDLASERVTELTAVRTKIRNQSQTHKERVSASASSPRPKPEDSKSEYSTLSPPGEGTRVPPGRNNG